MSVSTHASLIVKQLEFVEETTPGQMPTNPAMSSLAESAKLSYEVDVGGRMFRRHGSEDGYKCLQGKYKFKSTLEFEFLILTLIISLLYYVAPFIVLQRGVFGSNSNQFGIGECASIPGSIGRMQV